MGQLQQRSRRRPKPHTQHQSDDCQPPHLRCDSRVTGAGVGTCNCVQLVSGDPLPSRRHPRGLWAAWPRAWHRPNNLRHARPIRQQTGAHGGFAWGASIHPQAGSAVRPRPTYACTHAMSLTCTETHLYHLRQLLGRRQAVRSARNIAVGLAATWRPWLASACQLNKLTRPGPAERSPQRW